MNGRLPDPPAERLVYLSEDSQFTIIAARSVAASSFLQPPPTISSDKASAQNSSPFRR